MYIEQETQQIISTTRGLIAWVNERYSNRCFKGTVKNDITAGLAQYSLECAEGIFRLIEGKFPAPAFSLVRPLFESYVRQIWTSSLASEDYLDRVTRDDKWPSLSGMIGLIEASSSDKSPWTLHLRKSLPTLHSFVHVGLAQITPRYIQSGSGFGPNYSAKEITEVIKIVSDCVIRVCIEVSEFWDDNEAILELEKKIESLHLHRLPD